MNARNDLSSVRIMTDWRESTSETSPNRSDGSLNATLLLAIVSISVATLWIGHWDILRPSALDNTKTRTAEVSVLSNNTPIVDTSVVDKSAVPAPAIPTHHSAQSTALSQIQPPPDSTHARWLIDELAHIEIIQGHIDPSQAARFHRLLQRLIAQGNAAVPAIRDLLESDRDIDLSEAAHAGLVDFPTLRLALIDALGRMGGIEAERVLVRELQRTIEPREILALAETLEWLAPEQHRALILRAAEESLPIIASDDYEHSSGIDAAPLFSVLQRYGDETVAAQMERSPQWFKQYATVALANLRDGLGVAPLVRMGGFGNTPQGELALQLLTQIAVYSTEAQAALLDKIRADRIPDTLLQQLSVVLRGDSQIQLEPPADEMLPTLGSVLGPNPYSTQTTVDVRHTQTLYSINRSAQLSEEEITRRLNLIDFLLAETSTNPVAVDALTDARSALLGI